MVENVPPGQVWEALRADPQAQLVDVRTDAEWNFVGLPDLAAAGKQAVLIPWQVYPTMRATARSSISCRRRGSRPSTTSISSVAAASAAWRRPRRRRTPGFRTPTMSPTGSRAAPDAEGHRGIAAGWKAEGLPWRQR